MLRGLFEALGLQSFAKTSGSKGLQVYVPLNTEVDFDQTKSFARRVAELLEQRLPELVVSRMTKRLRPGKVLVDWSQNDDHKTTVTVYSIRARERPTVSTPVDWDEVTRCRQTGREDVITFDSDQVLDARARPGRPVRAGAQPGPGAAGARLMGARLSIVAALVVILAVSGCG